VRGAIGQRRQQRRDGYLALPAQHRVDRPTGLRQDVLGDERDRMAADEHVRRGP
jgi:hypothetical protein